jgi:hypothetical protein
MASQSYYGVQAVLQMVVDLNISQHQNRDSKGQEGKQRLQQHTRCADRHSCISCSPLLCPADWCVLWAGGAHSAALSGVCHSLQLAGGTVPVERAGKARV